MVILLDTRAGPSHLAPVSNMRILTQSAHSQHGPRSTFYRVARLIPLIDERAKRPRAPAGTRSSFRGS